MNKMVQNPNQDDDSLISRAFSAYFRGHQNRGIPSNNSEVREIKKKRYVVLENINGILAVYRVRNDGKLKGLKRWPPELSDK